MYFKMLESEGWGSENVPIMKDALGKIFFTILKRFSAHLRIDNGDFCLISLKFTLL